MDISGSGHTPQVAQPPEDAFGTALSSVSGIVVLDDRQMPGSAATIDHIVVGPAGVFVVDAKRYPGRIAIHTKGGLFRSEQRLYVGRRDCSGLAEKVAWQARGVADALKSSGVAILPPIVAVLCFIDGNWPQVKPPRRYAGVRLESERSIQNVVLRAPVLDGQSIDRLARALAKALPAR